MGGNRFTDRLRAGWSAGRYVCVGLDPDRAQLLATTRSGGLADRIAQFGRAIVDATRDLVVAYKPNSAFCEQFGPAGLSALQDLIGYIHDVAPGVVVILDAKRGDIEHTSQAYASALFDVYDADAVTVQPYLGGDALAPFLDRRDRGVIVLCRTSNPGGGEVQDLPAGQAPLYQRIAELAEATWNRNGNCGLLVGATYPRELNQVRTLAPSLPLLIAGAGRQQGAVREAVTAGVARGGGIIVSSSRAVTHASTGSDFAEAARKATLALHRQVTAAYTGQPDAQLNASADLPGRTHAR